MSSVKYRQGIPTFQGRKLTKHHENRKEPTEKDTFSTTMGYIIARVYRGRVTGIGVPFSRYKLLRVHVGTYARAKETHARTYTTRTRLTSFVEVGYGIIYFPFSKKGNEKGLLRTRYA